MYVTRGQSSNLPGGTGIQTPALLDDVTCWVDGAASHLRPKPRAVPAPVSPLATPGELRGRTGVTRGLPSGRPPISSGAAASQTTRPAAAWRLSPGANHASADIDWVLLSVTQLNSANDPVLVNTSLIAGRTHLSLSFAHFLKHLSSSAHPVPGARHAGPACSQ